MFGMMTEFHRAFLQTSEFAWNNITIDRYPVFVPNDYLYSEYAKTIEGHEKMEKWEIYAHAVRDLISNLSGLPKNDQQHRDRMAVQRFMIGRTKEFTLSNGKTYRWPYEKSDAKKGQ